MFVQFFWHRHVIISSSRCRCNGVTFLSVRAVIVMLIITSYRVPRTYSTGANVSTRFSPLNPNSNPSYQYNPRSFASRKCSLCQRHHGVPLFRFGMFNNVREQGQTARVRINPHRPCPDLTTLISPHVPGVCSGVTCLNDSDSRLTTTRCCPFGSWRQTGGPIGCPPPRAEYAIDTSASTNTRRATGPTSSNPTLVPYSPS